MRVFLATALLMFSAGTAAAQTQALTWDVDGTERRAVVAAPRVGNGAAPLLLAFHGAGDSAANFSKVGFERAWPEAVVVYMEGLARVPGAGGVFQTTDASTSNRDLRFVDVALADLRRRFRIDDRRIFATGFSNGAKLVYLLWATHAPTFAGFAPVAGMLTAQVSLQQAKPLIHIAGREDRQNEFREQLASIELGRRANGAMGKGTSCGADCTRYEPSNGAPVVTILHPGGHVFPGDSTERIVAFLRER